MTARRTTSAMRSPTAAPPMCSIFSAAALGCGESIDLRHAAGRVRALVPVGRLLIGPADAQRRRLVIGPADDLQRQRQPGRR